MSWFDDETKFLIGFVLVAAVGAFGAVKGCQYNTEQTMRSDAQRHAVQLECIKTHTPVECKELP